jgi:hypothetical protein
MDRHAQRRAGGAGGHRLVAFDDGGDHPQRQLALAAGAVGEPHGHGGEHQPGGLATDRAADQPPPQGFLGPPDPVRRHVTTGLSPGHAARLGPGLQPGPAAGARPGPAGRHPPEVPAELLGELADATDVAAEAIHRVQRTQVEQALWALPEPQRLAVTLMDLGGFTAAEAAAMLGRPPGQRPGLGPSGPQGAGGRRELARPGRPPRIRQLGDLRWRGSGRGTLGGLPVVAHTYQDPAGDRVVLLQADRSFPIAVGAHHPAGSDTWMSEVEGVVLFCADARLGLR